MKANYKYVKSSLSQQKESKELTDNSLSKNKSINKTFQKEKKLSRYEMDKIIYIKNKKNIENIKAKLDEINKKNEKLKSERKRRKFKTSILNIDFNKRLLPMENLFMKRLKDEKYRNIIKKLVTQRKVDKNEYNQLKLDLNIEDSSDYLDKEESENDDYFNIYKNNDKEKKSSFIEEDEFIEKEINFFGEELTIKQNKKDKDLYDKYMKLKRLKNMQNLKQMKIRNIFLKELKEGTLYQNEENNKNNFINKKFIRKKNIQRRKSKGYFKFIKKKFIKSLDDEYDSNDSNINEEEINYFKGIDESSIKEIERRKEEVLLKFKNDIIYKINKTELTFNELNLYDELVKKLKNFENNLSNEKYIKLLQNYFHNLNKQLKLSEERKLQELRINKFVNSLIDDMDIISFKKKKQETDRCHVLNYKDFNYANKLNNIKPKGDT